MENLINYNDFKNHKNGKKINESAQLIDDTWNVRVRFQIPASLVNAYVKKIKDEVNKNIRENFSDQEIAEEIANYIKSAYTNISNLPVSIIVGEKSTQEPTVQVQNAQVQTQVQTQGQTQSQTQGQTQSDGQTQGQGENAQPAQGQSQGQSVQPNEGQNAQPSQTQKTAQDISSQEI